MKLSLLSILLGAGMSVPQVYGLARPKDFAAGVRKFPRNYAAGVGLMLLATAWFLWIVNNEPIADFSAYKPAMLAGFTVLFFWLQTLRVRVTRLERRRQLARGA